MQYNTGVNNSVVNIMKVRLESGLFPVSFVSHRKVHLCNSKDACERQGAYNTTSSSLNLMKTFALKFCWWEYPFLISVKGCRMHKEMKDQVLQIALDKYLLMSYLGIWKVNSFVVTCIFGSVKRGIWLYPYFFSASSSTPTSPPPSRKH